MTKNDSNKPIADSWNGAPRYLLNQFAGRWDAASNNPFPWILNTPLETMV
jgi:hypothetical protein